MPIFVDIGGKIIPELFIGGYLGLGFGGAGGKTKESCRDAGQTCVGVSLHLGIEAQYHILPANSVNPWLGYGIGLESLGLSAGGDGQSNSIGFGGVEFARFGRGRLSHEPRVRNRPLRRSFSRQIQQCECRFAEPGHSQSRDAHLADPWSALLVLPLIRAAVTSRRCSSHPGIRASPRRGWPLFALKAAAARETISSSFKLVDLADGGKLYLDPRLPADAERPILEDLDQAAAETAKRLNLRPIRPLVFIYFYVEAAALVECVMRRRNWNLRQLFEALQANAGARSHVSTYDLPELDAAGFTRSCAELLSR